MDNLADKIAWKLRFDGLYGDTKVFEPDFLGGVCRRLARWKLRPPQFIDIYVYQENFFDGRFGCWVGFGSTKPFSLEPIIKSVPADSFVTLAPGDWNAQWQVADKSKIEALERTNFTTYEDWLPKGWAWFGRYFRSDQVEDAIAFVDYVISREREALAPARKSGQTEGQGVSKIRRGQDAFRSEVLELWGRKCALTGCRVVPALEAAHIVAWADNKKERWSTENGILLLGTAHKLFENGFISFDDGGDLRTELTDEDLAAVGLRRNMRLSRPLSLRQKRWMDKHRKKHSL
ncbi:HNH endonuclease [Bradyrhizobium sp. SZCCHNG3015]|uniref:HNH endonuclease n=1 Tax=Bradyrhizobium sp. SZCCHNG3015 TaxID=3057270 RepID=UPI0028EF8B80|nr:HNH endonuclease [Bradyrhizobium sp. SZCCHNG3015]